MRTNRTLNNSGRTVRNSKKIQNLKPFPKGVSGNPKGRPKQLPELDNLLVELLGSEDSSNSEAKALIVSLVKMAKKGNVRAAEILLDRMYGKPKQAIDMTTKGKSFNPPPLNDKQVDKLLLAIRSKK